MGFWHKCLAISEWVAVGVIGEVAVGVCLGDWDKYLFHGTKHCAG